MVAARPGIRPARRGTDGGRTARRGHRRAIRPTAITRRPPASSSANGTARGHLGARSAAGSTDAVPGCVGTTFQSRTCSREAELGEHALDDRRRRLGRAPAGQLPLGGERDPRDPRAAVAGRLADEQERRLRPRLEIGGRGARAGARRRRRPGRSSSSARSGRRPACR